MSKNTSPNKLLDDNKELIRIIGTALYPAIKQTTEIIRKSSGRNQK